MVRPYVVLICGVLTLATACAGDIPAQSGPSDDSAVVDADAIREIDAVLDTYVQAVNRMDLDLLLTIWADPDDVSVVSPIGRVQSLADLEVFFQGFRDTYTELEVQPSNVSIRTHGAAASVVYDYEVNGVATDGSPVNFKGWETQVQRHTQDGWRIAHVHYSVAPDVPPGQ